jgi:hypothetical protein
VHQKTDAVHPFIRVELTELNYRIAYVLDCECGGTSGGVPSEIRPLKSHIGPSNLF